MTDETVIHQLTESPLVFKYEIGSNTMNEQYIETDRKLSCISYNRGRHYHTLRFYVDVIPVLSKECRRLFSACHRNLARVALTPRVNIVRVKLISMDTLSIADAFGIAMGNSLASSWNMSEKTHISNSATFTFENTIAPDFVPRVVPRHHVRVEHCEGALALGDVQETRAKVEVA